LEGWKEAQDIVQAELPFLRENRYRRFELTGFGIAARAHERLGNLAEARDISSSVVSAAERLKDDAAIALAAANLASVLTSRLLRDQDHDTCRQPLALGLGFWE